ncbi:hypothetical protein B296_00019814 [Ensete ventricosum]|uniref:Uncharacterized protein n=1 Tax=Ensete ventricosum TaxID=4639 RepID=A0A427B225_ENSVE|nr:hypothetical protein B296_00019814 [Ensete ventricosum]
MGRQKVMINGLPKCFALVLFTYLLGCGEGRRSVEGEGRRRGHSKKREKKKENRENLDSKPFLDPDPMPPSLDDPLGMTLRIARYTRYARTIPYRAKLGKLVWYKISIPAIKNHVST